MPFANNVTIGGAGTTPTVSWTVPAGTNVDFVRVGIFDDQGPLPASGRKPFIFNGPALPPSATSFTVPAGVLEAGHRYVVRVELAETFGHVLNGNVQFLRNRSSAFFSLVPLPQGAPDVVYLPSVEAGICFESVAQPLRESNPCSSGHDRSVILIRQFDTGGFVPGHWPQCLALVYKLARGAPATASTGATVTPPPGVPHLPRRGCAWVASAATVCRVLPHQSPQVIGILEGVRLHRQCRPGPRPPPSRGNGRRS